MRSFKTFVNDVVRKPPFIFPMLVLAHLAALLYTLWGARSAPFPDMAWLQPAWMLAYTICWIGCCDMRKWAALGYLALTSADIILYFGIKFPMEQKLWTNALFPVDILFSFFVLFYYRRFY